MRFTYSAEPHPHLFFEELVDPAVYATMAFPDSLVAPGASWGITSSDPEYAAVLEHPGWKAFHEAFTSPAFVAEVLGCFAADMRREGCLVDAGRAYLGGFHESRADKDLRTLGADVDPDDVFTRLDFQSKGYGEYPEFVHLDWDRRIVGGILFFSDGDEEGLEGGELALYRDKGFRNDRWCHEPELAHRFRPRHNTGVIFLNSNAGFHGPRRIVKLDGRRRWLYFTISSRMDVWPHAPRLGGEARSIAPATSAA